MVVGVPPRLPRFRVQRGRIPAAGWGDHTPHRLSTGRVPLVWQVFGRCPQRGGTNSAFCAKAASSRELRDKPKSRKKELVPPPGGGEFLWSGGKSTESGEKNQLRPVECVPDALGSRGTRRSRRRRTGTPSPLSGTATALSLSLALAASRRPPPRPPPAPPAPPTPPGTRPRRSSSWPRRGRAWRC